MADKIRKERFTWKPGDIQVTFSQCKGCVNNIGVEKCAVYGTKPSQFVDNLEDCPDKEKE